MAVSLAHACACAQLSSAQDLNRMAVSANVPASQPSLLACHPGRKRSEAPKNGTWQTACLPLAQCKGKGSGLAQSTPGGDADPDANADTDARRLGGVRDGSQGLVTSDLRPADAPGGLLHPYPGLRCEQHLDGWMLDWLIA